MDANRFDHLTRWVSAGGTRRKILALLSALPLGGSAALLAGDELAEAKRRKQKTRQRKRRAPASKHVADEAQPHKKHCRRVKGKGHGHHGRRKNCQAHHGGNGNGKGQDKQPACQPESVAQTCADTCGAVQNNCQQAVDCGSCKCQPACPTCQRCNETTTTCEADPAQVDDPCGDGLLCQEDGQCACEGSSCGGCRACEAGQCVVDATILCTAQDQCHDAGVCDPQTGECTNPRRADGDPCDDGDLCTLDSTCQSGVCTGGPVKDCSGQADVCNDGACRSGDGACIKQPKRDGTNCNADNDSCTEGDSCQSGVCTAGAGVNCHAEDDQCNDGVCRPDGSCGKSPKQDGTPCGDEGTCQSGACQAAVCKELGDACNAGNNRCCQDDPTSCAVLAPNCYIGGASQDERCCYETRETCDGDCDCCGLAACEGGTCCNYPGTACEETADCCTGSVSATCVNSTCCVGEGDFCTEDADCCSGSCPDGFCQGCLALRQECESDNECCQVGGTAICRDSFDFDSANCCRPKGGTCRGNDDCCQGRACNNGHCCEGEHFQCDSDTDCCSDLECRGGICRTNICLEPGESCPQGSTPCCPGGATCGDGSCCYELGHACVRQGECCHSNGYADCGGQNGATCCIQDFAYAFIEDAACSSNDQCCSGYCHSNHMCCRTQGAACSEIGALGFECCPYLGLTCSANGVGGTCIPCHKPGEACEGSGSSSTCCIGSACVSGFCELATCGQFLAPCQDNSTCCPGHHCNRDGGICLKDCEVAGERCGFQGSIYPCCPGTACTGEAGSERCTPQ